ncbi:hypothetical protein GY21_10290 [Cryobacterium roopkundense]|uniref:Secreted protein n=1 Tax=Cryobacterium roopkundense TaxID=1001240 RepID=A0A099JB14_9MICO|nr:hypothetical protein GY21_10290 [Cryobacterium roopkundense]
MKGRRAALLLMPCIALTAWPAGSLRKAGMTMAAKARCTPLASLAPTAAALVTAVPRSAVMRPPRMVVARCRLLLYGGRSR